MGKRETRTGARVAMAWLALPTALLALMLLVFQNVSAICNATGYLCPSQDVVAKSKPQQKSAHTATFVLECKGLVSADGEPPYPSATILRINTARTDSSRWNGSLLRPIIVESHSYVPNAVVGLVTNCTKPTCKFSATSSRLQLVVHSDDPLVGDRYFSLSRVTGDYQAGASFESITSSRYQTISESGRCEPAAGAF